MNWVNETDRELIELARIKILEAIAYQLKQPPKSILDKAKKLGLTIKRKSKMKK
jgi:ribosomal protein L11